MMYFALGGVIVFGLWALVTMVRSAGLREKNARLEGSLEKVTDAHKLQTKEFLDYKKRAQERIDHLMEEIEELEDRHHAEIEKIEDPIKRRRRRRAFVADVLDDVQEASSASSADDNSLPENTAAEAGEGTQDS